MLFSPSGAPDAYLRGIRLGAGGRHGRGAPGPDTVWKQNGSGALGVDHPVTLTYDNGQGLVFTPPVAVDDHYLFTVNDQVANKGGAPVTLFPYGLISRHGTPPVLGYYILHEGPIGVMGEDGEKEESLQEDRRLKERELEMSPTPGLASPTNIGRRCCCPRPTPR